MTRPVAALGVVVPSRRDGGYAGATVRALLAAANQAAADQAAADRAGIPVSILLVDDGDNDDFGGGLPDDSRLTVLTTTEHGPGQARTTGARAFAATAEARGVSSEQAWIVSLDADVRLGPDFVTGWIDTIAATDDDILGAPAFFGPVGSESRLAADIEAASHWMWGDTSLYEHFMGLVNVGGCNHAVSVAVAQANGWYLQPTQFIDGVPTMVAGDDWDFGLRARMSGRTTARVEGPAVTTSIRRIAADPVGFLAGRSYERPFVPIRGAAEPTAWPPEEAWTAVARRGRARLVAHFLAKPLLAGLAPEGALEWFLGEPLSRELDKFAAQAPTLGTGSSVQAEWSEYRTSLIDLCFSDEVFGWCERVATEIMGAS